MSRCCCCCCLLLCQRCLSVVMFNVAAQQAATRWKCKKRSEGAVPIHCCAAIFCYYTQPLDSLALLPYLVLYHSCWRSISRPFWHGSVQDAILVAIISRSIELLLLAIKDTSYDFTVAGRLRCCMMKVLASVCRWYLLERRGS